jgi:hypothetical protein
MLERAGYELYAVPDDQFLVGLRKDQMYLHIYKNTDKPVADGIVLPYKYLVESGAVDKKGMKAIWHVRDLDQLEKYILEELSHMERNVQDWRATRPQHGRPLRNYV